MRWMIAALFVAGMISSATAEDTAQKAYEAVAFHLTLARSCSPEAYERAKAGTQETLDAGNYTERTAEEIFMLVEALETEPFPEAFCKDMRQHRGQYREAQCQRKFTRFSETTNHLRANGYLK